MTDVVPAPIDEWWTQADGQRRRVPAAVMVQLREALGEPSAQRSQVIVVRPTGSQWIGHATVHVEGGGEIDLDGELPPDVPLGYHRLIDDEGERTLIVAPSHCHLPRGTHTWGWTAQLYAARSTTSWGIGDLADLAAIGRWSARAGAGFALVNPLAAVAPISPGASQQSSPYFPSSRRFRSPLYLCVDDVPGVEQVGEIDVLRSRARALNADRRIDRDAVAALKLNVLAQIWAIDHGGAAFAEWHRRALAPGATGLAEHTAWCALAELHGVDWRQWPPELRRHDAPAVAAHVAANQDRILFHAWLQFLLDEQLRRADAAIGIIQDLPIGFDPGGADAWCWQDLVAEGIGVGAPPDEFNTQGQRWGLPPFNPWRLRDAAFRPFIETVRANMATGGGLRIDHVMGMFRLWWIPDGNSAADGGFVRYPAGDLLDIIALESHRAAAFVVGEDLGTVEPAALAALAERRLMSTKVLWFEDAWPRDWPAQSMATVTTHDLPTVAGLWDGSDLAEQQALDLHPNVASTISMRARVATRAGLGDDASTGDAVRGAYRLLASSPCALLSATLDDAVAEPSRPNLPGADGRRANWELALPESLEQIFASVLANDVAGILRVSREEPPES